MSAKAEQKQRSRRTIVESAKRLLAGRGIAGARVADVMAGAGLTVGGFYAHFASKRALVDEALRRTGDEVRARLFARLDDKPAADRAEVVLKRYLAASHRDDPLSGCPLPAVVGEIGTTASEHREVLADELGATASRLEAALPPRPALPRRQLALGIVALMYGGLSLARALRGTPLSDEILRASRAVGRLALQAEPRPADGRGAEPPGPVC